MKKSRKSELKLNDDIRIIQYLGSKLQILDDISKEIDNLICGEGIVCDLFAGSGTVSYKLSQKYTVYANDIQEYSKVITKVLLHTEVSDINEKIDINCIYESIYYKQNKIFLQDLFSDALRYEQKILDSTDYEGLAELCELNLYYDGSELASKQIPRAKEIFGDAYDCFSSDFVQQMKNRSDVYALFTLYYLNSYFSLYQCIEIDSIKFAIDKLLEDGVLSEYISNLFLACLIHAVSEIVSSVGKNFAQPIKVVNKNGEIKTFAIKRCMKDRKMDLKPHLVDIFLRLKKLDFHKNSNMVFCENSLNALLLDEMKNVDVFYLDPPYTIDHYSRFYHVLETLVKYDYPELEKKKLNGRLRIMNGRYRDDRFQSNFCILSKSYSEFELMIKRIHSLGASIVLSYSDDDSEKDTRKRVVSKNELVEILSKYYEIVNVKTLNHRYRKLSAKDDNRKEMNNSELLIICK
ncbi:MAG: DNA adenine methylase [Beduini sp.]|uniref:DNA adenine methylase n=1 Tax=Beduini sp. TaxID=1922300 RepID=UPI0039A25055